MREPSGFSGIVYAHGNEDILNFVAGNREKGKLSKDLKDAVMTQPYHPTMWTRRLDVEGEKENLKLVASASRQKRSLYSLRAQSIGMVVWKKLSFASGYYQQLLQSVKRCFKTTRRARKRFLNY